MVGILFAVFPIGVAILGFTGVLIALFIRLIRSILKGS
jgi:hypothetical protein